MTDSRGEVTRLLGELTAGEPAAQAHLATLVYDELHGIAQRLMRAERRDHTLQATALVHEAFLRLMGGTGDWESRRHFFAVAATAMRRILVDHARGRVADKRGGVKARVDLEDVAIVGRDDVEQVIAIDQVLGRLASFDARQARIVELRFFVGLREDEIADLLGLSTRTVKRDWRLARAWLRSQLEHEPSLSATAHTKTTDGSV